MTLLYSLDWTSLLALFFGFLGALTGGALAELLSVRTARRQRLEDAYSDLSSALAELITLASMLPYDTDADFTGLAKVMGTASNADSRILVQEHNERCQAELHTLREMTRQFFVHMGSWPAREDGPAVEPARARMVGFLESIQKQDDKLLMTARQAHRSWWT